MARHESDREDLIGEATALKRRAEVVVPQESAPVVFGFRSGGELSLYFGTDPVYHFDSQRRLRRAFVRGNLLRTQGQTLATLTRVRLPTATELRRHDLTPAELQTLRESIVARLRTLREALDSQTAQILRQVPADASGLLAELAEALAAILAANVPLAPAIRGKR